MNTNWKILLAGGIALLLALAVAGGLFVYTAYAQGGTTPPANGFGGCHNNQAVLDLLKTSAADLQAQRQAGKSLLDIATSKGVSEQALTDALMQPVDAMHSWMEQNVQGFNDEQMDQAMRAQISQDVRQAKYGTMTDFRLFSGPGGMMGGWNGAGYGGMMGGWNGAGPGGMMNGWNGARPSGMMNGWTY
ncbi:MAG: hypothetical protein ACM3JD_11495 [Rudaea sp.]